jgi:hypothetical protein
MPQNNPEAEVPTESQTPDLLPAEVAEAVAPAGEDMVGLQNDVFAYLQEANRNWFARMQAEAAIASEFTNKVTAARSVADYASAYQEWLNQHMKLLADDGPRLFSDTQKLIETGARILARQGSTHSP